MSESESKWTHAGMAEVKDRRLRIPDIVFQEAEIVTPGLPVYWSYETVVKILIISNQPLEDEEYETVDFTTMGEADDNYRCTVPSGFFEDVEEQGSPSVSQSTPEEARVRNGERRHFMYNTGMVEGDTKSCYVFTDQEFSDRFENTDIWDGTLDQVPQFL